jgi:uncharacterized protein (TIGR00255 family)
MIKSMTAFAQKELAQDDLTVAAEVRSYNSRHLDVAVRISHGYQALEERIKALVSDRLERGRLEVKVRIQDHTEAQQRFEVDTQKALAFHKALSTLQATLDLDLPVTLDQFVNAAGVIRPAEGPKDLETCWPAVQACVVGALEDLDEMRQREGAFIAQDFTERLALLEALLANVARQAEGLVEQYQDRLRERMAKLTSEINALDPQRIAQEAALLADRSDISEEIVRVRSHLAQYRLIMEADAAAGRKLNFLLQEFNREFNTMGAKAGQAEIAYLIVEAKAEIEKLREQVQNVE